MTITSSLSPMLPLALLLAGCGLAGPSPAAPPPGYKLAWSEEFKQQPGSKPDPARWNYDLGGHGWGNNELQNYVDDAAHAQVVADRGAGDGRALRIRATSDGNGKYTSARLHTNGKATAHYGYIEARLKLPYGQGIWPAFWMLGEDIGKVGWPACGEIDVMEHIGRDTNTVFGSLHGPGYSAGNALHASYKLPGGKAFKDGYHTFGVLWKKDAITFSVDGKPYRTRTPADLPEGTKWVFDKPHFFIVNLAVGGHWPGKPDATTVFPQDYLVDYIRVYREAPSK